MAIWGCWGPVGRIAYSDLRKAGIPSPGAGAVPPPVPAEGGWVLACTPVYRVPYLPAPHLAQHPPLIGAAVGEAFSANRCLLQNLKLGVGGQILAVLRIMSASIITQSFTCILDINIVLKYPRIRCYLYASILSAACALTICTSVPASGCAHMSSRYTFLVGRGLRFNPE